MAFKVSKELFIEASKCKTTDELLDFAKANNLDLSLEDAKKFIEQGSKREIDISHLENMAGGLCAGAVSIGCLGIGIT